jgi:hypothetical protein
MKRRFVAGVINRLERGENSIAQPLRLITVDAQVIDVPVSRRIKFHVDTQYTRLEIVSSRNRN